MKICLLVFSFAALFCSLGAAEEFNEQKYVAQGRMLERQGKRTEAFRHYSEGLKKKISPASQRMFLNRCAMLINNSEAKLEYLLRACMVKGGDPTESYRTYMLLGHHYERSSPDKALGYFLNFLDKDKIHPGLVFDGYLRAGVIMEKKKKYDKALEFYQNALASGKAVTYRFNYSRAEKAIKRVEALVKK